MRVGHKYITSDPTSPHFDVDWEEQAGLKPVVKSNDAPYQFNLSERLYRLLVNIRETTNCGSVANALSKSIETYHDEVVHGAVVAR